MNAGHDTTVAPCPASVTSYHTDVVADDGGLIMLGLYEWLHETIAEENAAKSEDN